MKAMNNNSMYPHTGVLVSLTIVLIGILFFTWKRKNKQPPLPPGPRGLPLLGSLLSLDPEIHTHFASLSRTYGPILTLRLGSKTCVVVSSPEAAREVLKDHDAIFANHDVPAVTKSLPYGGHDIVFSPSGPQWRMLRKVCAQGMLGAAALDGACSIRRREIRSTIAHLYGKSGCPVNIGEVMFLNVFRVVTRVMWGSTIQEDGGEDFRRAVAGLTEQLGKPNLSDFFPALAPLDLQGVGRKGREAAAKLERVFDEIIDGRQKVGGEDDFLQVLLRLKEEGDDAKIPLTMGHIKALLEDMVVGGTDTTSNTVEFAMAEILNKPDILKKAQQELDAVVGQNNLVKESHITKLPYLQAVMKEVLRLHPVLPLMVPHCPSESCLIQGYTIPKGARVFVNVWAIHRDPSIWENPTEFNPDRFLKGKGDYNGKDFSYFPFGSGRRICAGIGMAERMVMLSLASFLHSFDWELPAGDEFDITEKFGIVLKKKTPLFAVPTPRLPYPSFYTGVE